MNRRALFTSLSVVVVSCGLLFAAAGCKHDDDRHDSSSPSVKPTTKSLYDRLGGEPALTAVVHDFVGRAAGDPKVNFTRKGIPGHEWDASAANVAKLEKRLVQFIAMATGGPQKYEGKSMKSSHAGMKITEAEFNALAGHLVASLDKFNVPKREKDELMAVVGTTKADIVEVK
jgi:hemoglobin